MTDDTDKALAGTYMGLSQLIKLFNLDLAGFCKGLRKHHVLNTHQSSETAIRTALRSGVDRRIVTSILKNKKQYYKPPALLTILNCIETVAKNNEMLVNKKGINSVESIMNKIAPGATTLRATVLELLALGCIEDEGTKIRFIANKFNSTANDRKALRVFSSKLENTVNEMLKGNNNEP